MGKIFQGNDLKKILKGKLLIDYLKINLRIPYTYLKSDDFKDKKNFKMSSANSNSGESATTLLRIRHNCNKADSQEGKYLRHYFGTSLACQT